MIYLCFRVVAIYLNSDAAASSRIRSAHACAVGCPLDVHVHPVDLIRVRYTYYLWCSPPTLLVLRSRFTPRGSMARGGARGWIM